MRSIREGQLYHQYLQESAESKDVSDTKYIVKALAHPRFQEYATFALNSKDQADASVIGLRIIQQAGVTPEELLAALHYTERINREFK